MSDYLTDTLFRQTSIKAEFSNFRLYYVIDTNLIFLSLKQVDESLLYTIAWLLHTPTVKCGQFNLQHYNRALVGVHSR